MKCVYCLEFTDGKRYIGSTKNLKRRLSEHSNNGSNKKYNPKLREAILQGDYEVVILEQCPDDYDRKQLLVREQHYVNIWFDYGILYNKKKNVSGWGKGRKQSAEHIAKRSAANKGREHTAEHRAKNSAANRSQVWQYADEIKALRATGLSLRKIANSYNCWPETIRAICIS